MFFSSQKIRMIKTEEISPNPYQLRRNFNEKKLRQLADSIKEVGMLSPIIVRTSVKGYEIICGQRRFRAAVLIGMKSIPAVVLRAGDKQCAQLSMVENLQRENLELFEEAEGFYNLMSYHRVKKDELAKNLSLENGRINEKVRLLSLDSPIRYKIEENGIPEKTAKELLKLHDAEKQREILDKIIKEEVGVNELPSVIRETLREMSSGIKRGRKKACNLPLCINTVKKTADLLKKSGAKVELEQKEDEKSVEFTLKIGK